MRYTFEWDPGKESGNRQKHRINFERAAEVFADPEALSLFDEEHSEEEDRWITLGLDRSGGLLVVIHTFRQIDDRTSRVGIISARRAKAGEVRQYREQQR